MINASFDEDLKKLSADLAKVKSTMKELKEGVEDDLGVSKHVTIVDSNQHTFVFEVDKKEGDAGMRKSSNVYRVVSTKNRIMSFTCDELKELCRQYNELEEEYRHQQDELVDKVLEIVSTYYPLLEKVSGVISQLDVLSSFAQVSAQFNYAKPKIVEEGQKMVLI